MTFVIKIVKLVIWAILHHIVMGDVYVELGVVFIELGVVFIGGWGYLTLPRTLKMKRPASYWAVCDVRMTLCVSMTLCCHG